MIKTQKTVPTFWFLVCKPSDALKGRNSKLQRFSTNIIASVLRR